MPDARKHDDTLDTSTAIRVAALRETLRAQHADERRRLRAMLRALQEKGQE